MEYVFVKADKTHIGSPKFHGKTDSTRCLEPKLPDIPISLILWCHRAEKKLADFTHGLVCWFPRRSDAESAFGGFHLWWWLVCLPCWSAGARLEERVCIACLLVRCCCCCSYLSLLRALLSHCCCLVHTLALHQCSHSGAMGLCWCAAPMLLTVVGGDPIFVSTYGTLEKI